jgi:hypothetical protein
VDSWLEGEAIQEIAQELFALIPKHAEKHSTVKEALLAQGEGHGDDRDPESGQRMRYTSPNLATNSFSLGLGPLPQASGS